MTDWEKVKAIWLREEHRLLRFAGISIVIATAFAAAGIVGIILTSFAIGLMFLGAGIAVLVFLYGLATLSQKRAQQIEEALGIGMWDKP